MNISKEILKKANILPKLNLCPKNENGVPTPNGPHRVRTVSDRLVKGTDNNGNEITMVKYVLEEDGEQKFYRVPLKNKNDEVHYLVQRMAEIKEGQEIIMECLKKGPKNFIRVTEVGNSTENEIDEDEIPIINQDEVEEDEPKTNIKDVPF